MDNIDYSCNSDRLVVDLRRIGIHDVPAIGRHVYSCVHHRLEEHTHGPSLMEIVYLDRGCQTFIVGQEKYEMKGGDLFLTKPDEIHGTGYYPEERGVMYWVILRLPTPGAPFLGCRPDLASALFQTLLSTVNRVFPSKRGLKTHLDHVLRYYELSVDPLTILNIENHLMRFLLDVTSCVGSGSPPQVSQAISVILRLIEGRLCSPPYIDELAGACGLSESRFKSRFKQEVGCSPVEYITDRRIDLAKQLLQESCKPITEVAMELGFCSSQYFAQVFRRCVGMTPTDYRRLVTGEAVKDSIQSQ